MYISHPDKFIFFHTPKVAGSSIHIFFKDHYGLVGEQRCDPIPSIHHMSAKDYLNSNPQYKNYFKFSFVRNPFDRFVSAYSGFTQIRNIDLSPFSSFCEEFPHSKFSKDIHWIPQSELLCDDVGNIIPDFIGRYENLNDDLKTISNMIGIDINIGHHRKTNRTYYKQMFSSKTKDIIENFFSVDLNKFDYEF